MWPGFVLQASSLEYLEVSPVSLQTVFLMLLLWLTSSQELSGGILNLHLTFTFINLSRVSIVEGMHFVAATFGPFLSKALKEGLGPVYVFGGKRTFTFFVQKFPFIIFLANLLCHLAVVIYCFFLKEPSQQGEKKITCSELFSPKHVIDSIKTVLAPRPNRVCIT